MKVRERNIRDQIELDADVFHRGNPVGGFSGFVRPEDGKTTVIPYCAELKEPHRSKGLGTAAYEAAFAHAYHKLGARAVAGGTHSTLASTVHQKLAAKHGLEYIPKPSEFGAGKPGPFDNKYDRYRYTLKSEAPVGEPLEKASNDPLPLAVADEYGQHFETGKPVSVKFVRNTQKAPNFGKLYQQHIEPAGRYMLHNPNPGDPASGWECGEVSFQNPLVIALNTGAPEGRIYDENSWKAHLHRVFRKRGLALSAAIRARGHDGIVTVHDGGTREIVDLTGLLNDKAARPEAPPPVTSKVPDPV